MKKNNYVPQNVLQMSYIRDQGVLAWKTQYCATEKVGWATPGPNNYLTIILSASFDNSEP